MSSIVNAISVSHCGTYSKLVVQLCFLWKLQVPTHPVWQQSAAKDGRAPTVDDCAHTMPSPLHPRRMCAVLMKPWWLGGGSQVVEDRRRPSAELCDLALNEALSKRGVGWGVKPLNPPLPPLCADHGSLRTKVNGHWPRSGRAASFGRSRRGGIPYDGDCLLVWSCWSVGIVVCCEVIWRDFVK